MRRKPQVSSAAPCNDSYVSILSIHNLSGCRSHPLNLRRMVILRCCKTAAPPHHFYCTFRTLFSLTISERGRLVSATNKMHLRNSASLFSFQHHLTSRPRQFGLKFAEATIEN